MAIVEKEIRELNTTDRYKFYELVDAEDAEGNSIKVKKLSGIYTLADLENQKNDLTSQISKVQEKIDAINAL